MESGLPILNCLLQHTLRSLCFTCTDSSSLTSSSKWVYAVFWKILPRNYPPPKWEYGETSLDRSKKNKRNWILVWEDGFCDFHECERVGSTLRFGADVFFKMSHEVYNFGEGLVGNVAADNGYKWVFSDSPSENDPDLLTSWNATNDPQPKAWKVQFHSGIQTIAVISVREGLIQLGSFEKIDQDQNLVMSIQQKFNYLLSLPGFYTVQRPYLHLPFQSPYNHKEIHYGLGERTHLTGLKRVLEEKLDKGFPFKSLNLGYNSPHWHIPPLFPSMPCSFTALLSNGEENAEEIDKLDYNVKTEPFCVEGNKEKDMRNPQLELSVALEYGHSID